MAINFLFDVAVNSGIDLQNTSITSLATPVNNTDAATKAYVDGLVTASDLDFSGTSGTGAVDLDSQVFAVTGGTFISTAASGQSLSIDLNATGSPSATTFLRGDNTWSTPPDNNTTYTFAAVSGTPNLIRLTGTNPSSTDDIGLVATGNIAITFNSATSLGFDLASSISVANTITAGTGLTVTTGGVDITGIGTFNTGVSITGDSSINGELDMSSNKIINVTDPTNAQDAATKNYVDITSTSGAVNFQGGYDAATNTPDLDSNPSSAIKKGWMYTVTADGTFFTEQVRTGDSLIAQIDAPTTLANWTTVQNNIDLADASTVGIGNVAGTTNDINVVYSAGTATVSQVPITISQTTSNISPGFGSGFTAIDSVGANSTGHVTSLNLKTINLPTPTFTSVGITETGNALTITNSPITTSGNINIAGAGTASQVILGNLTLGTYTTGTVESVEASNSTFINGSGGPITGSGFLTYSLSATGTPSASTYLRGDNTWSPLPNDNNNYVTSASFGTGTGVLTLSRQGLTAVTVDLDGRYLTSNQNITLTGDITGGPSATSIATTISSNVVGANELNVSSNGTSGQVLTSDGIGGFTWSTPFTGDITGVTAGNGLTGGGTAGTVTLTVGAGTGIQVNSTNVALATAGAGAGTYGSTSDSVKIDTITLDAYGRVTAVSTGDTGSGNVTGSGTAGVTGGQIPYWDATTNITGTTELNYSTIAGGTIGRVGIGNNSNSFGFSRLVVGSGVGSADMTLYGGGSGANTIAFANGTSGNAQYRGQIRYNLQNDNLEFLTNGETFSRVYVDSAFDLNLVERSLNFRNSWPYAVGAYVDLPTNNELSIGTNGSERMRIDSSGDVGIGTTNPTEKLHVVGSTLIEGSSVELKVEGSGSYDTANITMGNAAKADTFEISVRQDPGDNYATLEYDGYSPTGTSHVRLGGDYLDFNTAGSSRMRINSTGRVGIATTNPLHRLQIGNGSGNESLQVSSGVESALYLSTPNSTAQSVIGFGNSQFSTINTRGRILYQSSTTAASNYMQFTVAFNEVMRLTNDRLGIGTTNPQAKLHVNGNVTANRYYGNASTVYYVDPNDSTTAAKLAGGLEIGYGSAGEYRIEVGEGRTGNGYAYIDFVGDTTYSDYGLRLIRNNLGANTSSQLIHRGAGTLNFKNIEAAHMTFDTSNTERMRIESGGNVGIGTTSPDVALDVNDSSGIKVQEEGDVVFEARPGDGYFSLGDAAAVGGGAYITGDSSNIDFFGDGDVRFRNEGKVGINATDFTTLFGVVPDLRVGSSSGVNNPGVIDILRKDGVVVAGDIAGVLQFSVDDDNNYAVAQIETETAATTGTGSSGGGILKFKTSPAIPGGTPTERLRIDETGDVGIGTTNPQSKLQINGAVQVANDTDTASASKVGALRYRTSGNNSYVDMCMQTGSSTYVWVNIVQNTW